MLKAAAMVRLAKNIIIKTTIRRTIDLRHTAVDEHDDA